MCYEKRFLESWVEQKALKRDEIRPEERARPDAQPIRPAPEREITRRKEVERGLEEIV